MAEPYFEANTLGWEEANALLFWFQCDARRQSLHPDCRLLPAHCRVVAMAVSCDELHRMRQPVDSTVEGVDVRAMNEFVDSSRVDSVQMWTHKYTPASEPVTLYEIDFGSLMADFDAEAEVRLLPGLEEPAHAIMLWVDFFAREEAEADTLLYSTGPEESTRGVGCFYQGVQFLEEPTSRQIALNISCAFDCSNGSVSYSTSRV